MVNLKDDINNAFDALKLLSFRYKQLKLYGDNSLNYCSGKEHFKIYKKEKELDRKTNTWLKRQLNPKDYRNHLRIELSLQSKSKLKEYLGR